MDFRPEKIFLGTNADGSAFRIEQWNYDSRAGFELIGGCMNIFAFVLAVQFMSPIFLVMCILNFNGRANILNIIGIVLGSYFLYDASHGWLVTAFLRIFLNDTLLNLLVYVNAIGVALHVVLLLFSGIIYQTINKTCETEEKCKETFSMLMIVISFIVIVMTNNILSSNPGWVDKNLQESIERNKEPEPEPVEETKPAYDDGFFHADPNWDPMK